MLIWEPYKKNKSNKGRGQRLKGRVLQKEELNKILKSLSDQLLYMYCGMEARCDSSG